MDSLFEKLDEIIEDTRKTKQVIRWMMLRGFIDETSVAIWEVELNNKEAASKLNTRADDDFMNYGGWGGE